MAYESLELAFALFNDSQHEGATAAQTASRLEQARTAALLSIAEALADLAAAVDGTCVCPPPR
ncbi:hypothetical protein [Sinomonas atrocyanea]